ncbi:MAG: radical SAM protein, partial [bacterium]
MENVNQSYQENSNGKNLCYGIIEVTAQCQLRCPGCYMVKRNALGKNQISYELSVKILDLCKEFIGKELDSMDILGGEPLLWPYLKEYVSELLKRGISPWIFTNMLAITPELAKWLFERKVYITGKLNVDPDDHSQIQLQASMLGGNIAMAKKLFSKIKIFKKAGYTSPFFILENLIRKKNIEVVPAYYAWCLKNKISPDIELVASGESINQKYWDIAPTPEQIAIMINKIQEVRNNNGLEPAKVIMPHIFGKCRFYDKGLYFSINGDIRACSNST